MNSYVETAPVEAPDVENRLGHQLQSSYIHKGNIIPDHIMKPSVLFQNVRSYSVLILKILCLQHVQHNSNFKHFSLQGEGGMEEKYRPK